MVGGFILRFGRGFGTFVTYAKKDDDFLELGRLDIVFGLFTAAACVLMLSFFLALIATLRKNKFLLKTVSYRSLPSPLIEALRLRERQRLLRFPQHGTGRKFRPFF